MSYKEDKSTLPVLRVAGKDVIPSLDHTATWRELVAYFIGEQTCRESSKRLYLRNITRFFLWVEETGREIPKLTKIDISAYKSYLFPEKEEDRKVAPLTAGSYLVVVRKFFEWAESYKLYPNIAKNIKSPAKLNLYQKHYLHEEETAKLLDLEDKKAEAGVKCSLRDRAMITLMLYTGLRTIEVSRANIGDFDIDNGRRILKVWGKGHSGKDSLVVINDEVFDTIVQYLAIRKGYKDTDPLFVSESQRGSKTANLRLSTRTISGICKKGLQDIGLDSRSYTAHSLRHTAGSLILKGGGTIFDVQKVLRHSSPSTSQIYVNMIEREQRVLNPGEDILAKMLRRF